MSREGRVSWMPGGVRTEIQPPPGRSLPPHRHANESETIRAAAARHGWEFPSSTG